jgi:hypothetical protein
MKGITHGAVLGGIGAAHTLLGLALFARQWWSMAASGLVHTLPHRIVVGPEALVRPDLELAFWFTIVGPALAFGGIVLHRLERLGQPIPRSVPIFLLVIAIIGAAMMPLSGFTLLLLPEALVLLLRPSKRALA